MPVELLYYCKKCKLKLNHDAIVMTQDKIEKIRCNTCKTVSKYKDPNQKKTTSTTPKVPKKGLFTQEEIDESSNKEPKNYHMHQKYEKGDIIFHAKFGGGKVVKAEMDKITVKFPEEGLKILVHNYQQ